MDKFQPFALLIVLIITISCSDVDDLLDPSLTEEKKDTLIAEKTDILIVEVEDTFCYFVGEILDTSYNWVMTQPVIDTLAMEYSSINPDYLTPHTREMISGISYGPYCCEDTPEKTNKRIAIHVIDSIHYDPDNNEDRERLKSLFEKGKKLLGVFSVLLFLPPEVVLDQDKEYGLMFREFEVEYIENINDSLHHYSTKWKRQDVLTNRLEII